MNRLGATFYDAFLAASEAGGLRRWRQELLQHAHGSVLEIGPGTGLNLPLYPSQGLTQLVLSEPSPPMRTRLEARLAELALPFPTTTLAEPADALSAPDNSVDVVVCTLVLCTVPHPKTVLTELQRVLKPGGALLFIEHVAASRGMWVTGQRLVEPLWKPLAGGCCLTRATLATITASGFTVTTLQQEPMPWVPGFLRPCIRGIATCPDAP